MKTLLLEPPTRGEDDSASTTELLLLDKTSNSDIIHKSHLNSPILEALCLAESC